MTVSDFWRKVTEINVVSTKPSNTKWLKKQRKEIFFP